MGIKRVCLTEEQFQKLRLQPGWRIVEVPMEVLAEIPEIQRRDDTLAIMGSGCAIDSREMHGVLSNAGIDVLILEPNPNEEKNEPEGNAYHYVFQRTSDPRCPWIMYGPYKKGTLPPHWFGVDDIDVYPAT